MKKIIAITAIILIGMVFFVNAKPKTSNTLPTPKYPSNLMLEEIQEQKELSKKQVALLEQILSGQQVQEEQIKILKKQTELLEEILIKQADQITFLSSMDSYLQSIDRNLPL